MSLLVTSALGKDYGSLTAVHSLDLSVAAGEIFGLLGPNGAGKTTSISMISGVLTPTRGTASIAGHDIRREPFAAKRTIGLVTQEIAVYEDLSARENLAYFGGLYGLKGDALKGASDWSLGVAGLADRAVEPIKRFSGGMKRRLNLAVGLLHRPALLICDEPTVGVDPQSRAHIFDTLRALNRDHGTTIIYTSHYMEEVQALCARIGIIDHGKLVALDSLENLLRAHGKAGMELQVEGDAAQVVAAIAPLSPAQVIDGRIQISGQPPVAALARAVEATGARIRSLVTSKADLETVFLNLTGHQLRDAP